MHFDPPPIENIKDVLPIIKDNSAFVVKQKDWYTVIDYMYMSDDMFHHPIERECRGLKFCSKTGDLLARPYHKFHNLNERPAFATANVDLTKPHVVLDKLDGSMVHTCASSMGIYLMTRMGITEVAQAADKFLCANPIKFARLFGSLSIEDYTYIFEYIGPNNKIVLNYKEEALILTAIRHNHNGTYLFHDELVKLGKAFGIPVVPIVGDPEFKLQSHELAESVSLASGIEGVVIRFDTGEMIKIKADEYVRKHRSKELIGSPKGLIGLIVSNTLDDILPQLDEDVQKQVVDYTKQFLTELGKLITRVSIFKESWDHLEQKDYALKVQHDLPKPIQCVAFRARAGHDVKEEMLNVLKRNLQTNKRIQEVCETIKLPVWTYSFFTEE